MYYYSYIMPTPARVAESTEGNAESKSAYFDAVIDAKRYTPEGFMRFRFPQGIDPHSQDFKVLLSDLFQSIGGDSTTPIGIFYTAQHVEGLRKDSPNEGYLASTTVEKVTPGMFEAGGIGYDNDLVLFGLEHEAGASDNTTTFKSIGESPVALTAELDTIPE